MIIPLFGFNYFLTLVGPDREESEFWYMVFQIGRSVLIRWRHFYLLLVVRAEPNICYIITLLFSRNRSPAKSNLQKHSFLLTISTIILQQELREFFLARLQCFCSSLQGAIITLPYCFLNSEVRGVLSLHWSRFGFSNL